MKQFKKSISNKNFERLLANPENIPFVQYLMNKEQSIFEELFPLGDEKEFDYSPFIDKSDLSDLLAEVKDEVDCFLDTPHISKPSIDYNGFFSRYMKYLLSISAVYLLGSLQHPILIPSTLLFAYLVKKNFSKQGDYYIPSIETILLDRKPRTSIIPSIAHEYAHHVIWKQNFIPLLSSKERKGFEEGFARGVERYIANLYRQRENNPAFLLDHNKEISAELADASSWIIQQNKIKRPIDCYTLGTPLIYIHELKNGPGIYKEMAHGRYKFE